MVKQSQRMRIMKLIEARFNTAPEYLWRKYPEFCVYRKTQNRKWFALVANVGRKNLGLMGDGNMDVIIIHCPPSVAATVLPDDAFMPGYHMNKKSWTTLFLDDRLTDAQIMPLIHASFDSV